MLCPRCRQENPPQAKFCVECATPLGLTCAKCGTNVPITAKFCPECAHPVASRPAEPPRFVSPEAYTPAHLAERILTSRSAIEGERKQVTVLFADLKGSMELLADRDPEDVRRRLLDPVLERMMEAVHRYEGTVNQVMGDGIMALFGAPLAHEDHAVRACYAALRMQESVKRYADEIQPSEGAPLPIQIRVGLNSGEVVVRSIGSDLHMDYTAVGRTTHLAARMEQTAVPGTILITTDVWRLTEGYVQAVSLGSIPVKGLNEPLEVYELIGAGPIRSRLQASASRGLTRFVGRDAELDGLHQALQKARGGRGQIVAIIGEPGMGKSRLFWEFTHLPETHGWLILEAGCASYERPTPFLPVIELLKAYFQIEDRDGHHKIRDKVTGKLLTRDEAGAPTLPALLALLDVPADDPKWEALDPPQRRQWTLDGVRRLLLRESQVQPVVLMFEDLHWIDSDTQDLLDGLVESLPTTRMLLVVNYRPQYQHRWGSKTYYTQLGMHPLAAGVAETLLQDLLGSDPGLEPLKRLLIERTEGNPFFMEEIVRTLVESDVLVGQRGAYRLTKAPETIQVPATVHAVLAARIDRLPADEKRLLQAASAVGKDVPFVLLQAIAELGDEELGRGLARLRAGEFLYETALFPELQYTFKHALTHEVAYQGLLHERRRVLHARIVDAMEAAYRGRLAEQVERLAHHALLGEVWEKALTYFRQAGTKAAARSSYREAVSCFEQALVALKHLPETRDSRQQAIDLRFALRNSLVSLGKIERILEYLREAEPLAEALEDRRRLGRVAAYMASYFWWVGEYERAIESGQRALAIAADLGDFALQVFVNFSLGQIYHAMGDYRQALEFTKRNVQALQGEALRGQLRVTIAHVLSRTWLVDSLAELGEFGEAIALGEEGVAIAEAADHPYSRIVADLGVGYAYIRKGDLDNAVRVLERALALCQGGNLPVDFVVATAHLGSAYTQAGRAQDAVPLLEQSMESTTSIGLISGRALILGCLGEASLRAGRTDRAIEFAGRALEHARVHKERGYEAWTLRLLGELATRQDPTDLARAQGFYRESQALAQELGMRPLVAHTHLGLGRVHRKAGDRAKAEASLVTASTLFREMGMPFGLEQAEAELRALSP